MATIFLNNASACVNVELLKAIRYYENDYGMIRLEIKPGTLSPPTQVPSSIGFERSVNGGASFSPVQILDYTQVQYTWIIDLLPNIPLGSLFRVRLTTAVCGQTVSNAVPLTLS